MLGVKESLREKLDADRFPVAAAPRQENIETERNATPEMAVVMGIVALGAMIIGFLLGLLF